MAAEVALRDEGADGSPETVQRRDRVQEDGEVGRSKEPDLLDLTEDQLEELAEQRLEQQETTSPFTVDLDGGLKRRLDRLINRSKLTGRRLTITAVVFEGLEKNRGQYGDVVSAWREGKTPVTEGKLFSQPEHRRWSGRSAEVTTATITVRPTSQQRALIEKAVLLSGARSRKEFVEAVLDSVLPQLPGRPRKL
ncbi:hypothetical protein ADL05_23235 [Nocardiopsis sp. NRRL B-16309]|nr:hypothetical protein ADL05_23235 [Nocardiopsis sp. NRRL B-16309]